MKSTHEEEITSLMTENEKLQGLLDISKRRIHDTEAEIEQLQQHISQLENNRKICLSAICSLNAYFSNLISKMKLYFLLL